MDKATADLFCGEWIDAACRFLQVRVADPGGFAVSCLGPDRKPFSRSLLDRESPSLDMPACIEGERLVVEVGTPGLFRVAAKRGSRKISKRCCCWRTPAR
jgi:hypothetical protein